MGRYSRLKELARDTAVYGSGEAALRVVSIALSVVTVPIFTRVFTPADYGVMELLGNVSTFLGPLLTLTLEQALALYYYEEKSVEGRRRLAGTGFSILAAWSAAVSLGAALAAGPVSDALLGRPDGATLLRVVIVTSAAAAVTLFAKTVLRLTFRPGLFSLLSVLSVLAANLAGLAAVVLFGARILGVFVAGMAVQLLTALVALAAARGDLLARPSRAHAGRLAALVPALVFSALVFTLNSLADRWFVVQFLGLDATGLYSMAARFAQVLAMLLAWFSMAWAPVFMRAVNEEGGEDTEAFIEKVAHYLFAFFFLAGFGAAAFSRQALHLLTPPVFHPAYDAVGPLCLAMVYVALQLVTTVGFLVNKRVRLLSAIAVMQFLLTVFLQSRLVPAFGVTGAAWGAAGSAFFYLGASAVCTARMVRARWLRRPRTLLLFALYSLLVGGLPAFRPASVWLDFAVKAAALLLMVPPLFLARMLDAEDVGLFRLFLAKAWGKVRSWLGRGGAPEA